MTALDNLVHETTTSTGTGNLTVSAVDGRQTFNTAFGTGSTDVFYYFISHRTATEWEVGTGHLSAATTFVRDTVLASTNSGSAVNFSAGTKDVTNDMPFDQQIRRADVSAGDGITVTNAGGNNTLTIAIDEATQAQQETGTASDVVVTPDVQEFHDSAVKSWANVNTTGTTVNDSYNLSSYTDVGTGQGTFNITNALSGSTSCSAHGQYNDRSGIGSANNLFADIETSSSSAWDILVAFSGTVSGVTTIDGAKFFTLFGELA